MSKRGREPKKYDFRYGVVLPADEECVVLQEPNARRKRKRGSKTTDTPDFDWRALDASLSGFAVFAYFETNDRKFYTWQESVARTIISLFKGDGGGRYGICAGVGTGKSFLIMWLASAIRCQKPVLILAQPSLHAQIRDEMEPTVIHRLTTKTAPHEVAGKIFISSVEAYAQRTDGPEWSMVIVDERRSIGSCGADCIAGIRTKRLLMAAVEAPMTYPIGLLELPSQEVMLRRVFWGGEGVPLPTIVEKTIHVKPPPTLPFPATLQRANQLSYEHLGYKIRMLNEIIQSLPSSQKAIVVVPQGLIPFMKNVVFGIFSNDLRIARMVHNGDDDEEDTGVPYGFLLIDSNAVVIEDNPPEGMERVEPGTAADMIIPFVTTQLAIPTRNEMINGFLKGTGRVLIASAASIMVGRNMQRATTIVYLSKVYFKGDYLQLCGRCCRPNAYLPTISVYFILLENTFEEARILYYEYRPKVLLTEMRAAHTFRAILPATKK